MEYYNNKGNEYSFDASNVNVLPESVGEFINVYDSFINDSVLIHL